MISIHALREEGDHPLPVCRNWKSNFYPRPPRGGRPINARVSAQCNTNFYPCPPRGGRRCGAACFHLPDMISIHALRAEGDRVRVAGEFPRQEFLSTPSARRATLSNRLWLGRLFISIHALREEGDAYEPFHLREKIEISIHALREEGDPLQSPPCALLSNFYPRPPRGGRLLTQQEITQINDFYPRPPRGGRPASVLPWVHASRFLSTPSARRATCPLEPACADTCISIHALREEGDRNRCFRADRSADFYPRPPRGGRQSALSQVIAAAQFLSTPSARRATAGIQFFAVSDTISIHALREEGDDHDIDRIAASGEISIHALREEGDS